ncbi:hypothetical protein V501_00769 [Pseudogymnoascus sp. VKM F-4519 (FW-2642)]|nr:hypothetical protein V501_00769 [Pseudogymnoascus sp. VKM F-4519 (FW-2642)]
MQFSISTIALYATLFLTVSALPLTSRALSSQAYNDLSISAGQAGDAEAEAAAKIGIDSSSDLANVSKADLQIVKGIHDVANAAEVGAFNPAVAAATGAEKVAIQNGKIKNKVLKLSAAVLALQIQEAQGDSSVATKLAAEQKKLANNIALDTKAAGQDSTAFRIEDGDEGRKEGRKEGAEVSEPSIASLVGWSCQFSQEELHAAASLMRSAIKMSGGSFAFYRFSIILLLGNLAWTTRSNSLFVSKHATELIGPQFNSNIGRGEQTIYIGLTFCFWYNLVAWILSILDSCVVQVYIGLIDLCIVAALIPAVYWQGTYIPHWKSTCQNAASWQVSNASDESWFTVLAKLQKPAEPDPKGCCEKYVETWIFTVVVMRGRPDAGTASYRYVMVVDMSANSVTHRRLFIYTPANRAAQCATRIPSPSLLGRVAANADHTSRNKWSA